MKTIIAAALATMISTTASAETVRVYVGSDIVSVNMDNICARHGETASDTNHKIRVYSSGQVIVGRLLGAKYNFGFICEDIRPQIRHGGDDGFNDQWSESDLVDDDGNVNMGAGETKVDHGNGGPPSIDS